MDGFPSGQRGQTVNLLATPSKVRILLHPLEKNQRFANQNQFGSVSSVIRLAVVAQLAEQLICNQQVTGSSPVNGLVPLRDFLSLDP